MGFKSYRFTVQPNDSWLLDDPQPLRFSGPNGLIAQWYRLHRLELSDGPWIVPAAEWLSLTFNAAESAQRWIVFEQAEGGVRKFARMERINGQFGSQARIMMLFKPPQCTAGTMPLVVSEPARGCGWSEELSIDGGCGSEGCTWRWRAPQLGFASVVGG